MRLSTVALLVVLLLTGDALARTPGLRRCRTHAVRCAGGDSSGSICGGTPRTIAPTGPTSAVPTSAANDVAAPSIAPQTEAAPGTFDHEVARLFRVQRQRESAQRIFEIERG